MAEQWLSIVEYARATGTSDMTIRRRIRTGKIRADLRDGKYFISVSGNQVIDSSSRPQLNSQTNNSSSKPQSGTSENSAMKNRQMSNHTVERSTPAVRRVDEMHQANHYQVAPNYIGHQNIEPQMSAYSNTSNSKSSHSNFSRQSASPWNNLPGSVTGPLVEAGMASVEARTLIEFCDRALNQASSTVQAIEGKFSARIDALTGQLDNRAREISVLNQQIEDLQLLVQILERKRVS